MNLSDLREFQAEFANEKSDVLSDYKKINFIRQQFVKDYSLQTLNDLAIDEYVIGKQGDTFCNRLENDLNDWGNIHGSTAIKFGIYFGKEGKDKIKKYRFAHKFGNDYKSAFQIVKNAIIHLIKCGAVNDYERLINNPISPMFKGKILSLYYPEKYLNIYSAKHLNHFINALALINNSKSEIVKQKILIDFKNQDSIMKDWTTYYFTRFLYTSFGRPNNKKDSNNTTLSKYKSIEFPPIEQITSEFVKLNLADYVKPNKKRENRKVNYSIQSKNSKKIGNRGEQIVIIAEQNKLQNSSHPDLVEKVVHTSKTNDRAGYDIESYDINGNKILIEVKATTKKIGQSSFYLTSNELNVSKKNDNYYIYYVYEVDTFKPKIWIVNPDQFLKDKSIELNPVLYRIDFNTIG